ncbi:JAB domain-containing protein [Sphingomonas parapaucimobilis]|uniref:JAB domain-containing protein n=1 Tax=Sphingomonas parapaucimobilis TaxID=28213 RepID=UPI00321A67DB
MAASAGDAIDVEHAFVRALLEHLPGTDPERTARQLIAEFGTLAAATAAAPHRLLKVCGGDPAPAGRILAFRQTMLHVLGTAMRSRPVLVGSGALLDYLRADMAFAPVERFRVLHLNCRNMLIRDEIVSRGTVDGASIYIREIVARALELGSTGLIVVHNHPSGDPSPSVEDVNVTRRLMEATRAFDIELHDHVIVGAGGCTSLRASRLL